MFNISVQTASDSCRLGLSWSVAHKMPSFYFFYLSFDELNQFRLQVPAVDPEGDHCCCQVSDREGVTWPLRGRELRPLLWDRCDPKEILFVRSVVSLFITVRCHRYMEVVLKNILWRSHNYDFPVSLELLSVLSSVCYCVCVSVKLQGCLWKWFMWDIA